MRFLLIVGIELLARNRSTADETHPLIELLMFLGRHHSIIPQGDEDLQFLHFNQEGKSGYRFHGVSSKPQRRVKQIEFDLPAACARLVRA